MSQTLFISLVLSIAITCGNFLPHEHDHDEAEEHSVLVCEQCLHLSYFDGAVLDTLNVESTAGSSTHYKSSTNTQNSHSEYSAYIRAPPLQNALSTQFFNTSLI